MGCRGRYLGREGQGCRDLKGLLNGDTLFRIAVLTKCCSGHHIKNNEMGRACGTYEGKVRGIRGFGGEVSLG